MPRNSHGAIGPSHPPPTHRHVCLPFANAYSWHVLALDNWAVRDKFTYRTPSKEPSKARYVSADADCRRTCNASKQHDGMIELRVTRREHTCWISSMPVM